MSARIAYVIGLSALLSGCTWVGLSRDIERAQCADDSDCYVLNDREDPQFDPCRPFQCNAAHLCERAALDYDHDGFPPTRCVKVGEVGDCDDSQSGRDVYPGAAERCNQRDDDCDQRNDEGLLEQRITPLLDFGTSQAVTTLGFAPDAERSTLTLGYLLPAELGQVALSEVEAEADARMRALPLSLPRLFNAEPRALSLALSRLPDAGTAIASFVQDDVPRVLVGSLQLPDTALGLSPRIARYGLSCASTEDCAQNSTAPAYPMPTPPSSRFALASGDGNTVVVYAREPRRAPDTGPDGAVAYARSPRQLLANLLVTGAGDLPERTSHALDIAQTADLDAASLLFVPSGSTRTARGFLVAFADETGQLVVHQLLPRTSGLELSPQLLTLPATRSDWHSAQLALGHRTSAESVELGLLGVRGWEAEARTVAMRLSARFGSDGRAELRVTASELVLDDAPAQHAASMAWNGLKLAWAVAFRSGTQIRVRVLSNAFEPLGPALSVDAGPALTGDGADRLAVMPLASDPGWFGIFHQASTDDARYGLRRVQLLSCERP